MQNWRKNEYTGSTTSRRLSGCVSCQQKEIGGDDTCLLQAILKPVNC